MRGQCLTKNVVEWSDTTQISCGPPSFKVKNSRWGLGAATTNHWSSRPPPTSQVAVMWTPPAYRWVAVLNTLSIPDHPNFIRATQFQKLVVRLTSQIFKPFFFFYIQTKRSSLIKAFRSGKIYNFCRGRSSPVLCAFVC